MSAYCIARSARLGQEEYRAEAVDRRLWTVLCAGISMEQRKMDRTPYLDWMRGQSLRAELSESELKFCTSVGNLLEPFVGSTVTEVITKNV